MSDRDVNHLCPELLPIYREWLIRCHAAGLAVKVICTWRSAEEQNIAKAKGLSRASAGNSPHNCVDANGKPASKAFDFAVFDENAAYVTDGKDDRYTQAGEIGEDLGLIWGGKFKSLFDPSHLEMPNWKGSI
jgi:peptidoglycan LD-endopeptidase CwlK